jgi:hypothetical protein
MTPKKENKERKVVRTPDYINYPKMKGAVLGTIRIERVKEKPRHGQIYGRIERLVQYEQTAPHTNRPCAPIGLSLVLPSVKGDKVVLNVAAPTASCLNFGHGTGGDHMTLCNRGFLTVDGKQNPHDGHGKESKEESGDRLPLGRHRDKR